MNTRSRRSSSARENIMGIGTSRQRSKDCPWAYHSESVDLVVVPIAIGQLIFFRQQFILQYLNRIVEEILSLESETGIKNASEKKAHEALTTAFSNLDVQPGPLKSSLPEVRVHATESRAALEN
jgi:hypothetical protein